MKDEAEAIGMLESDLMENGTIAKFCITADFFKGYEPDDGQKQKFIDDLDEASSASDIKDVLETHIERCKRND